MRSVIYEPEMQSVDDPESVCRIIWDTTKPNGTPRKRCDISRLSRLGYVAQTDLPEGIRKAYADYLNHKEGNGTKRRQKRNR